MTPVRSVKNQYLGINAHLHSRLQAENRWNSFHARHIIHIADVLKTQLWPLGYTSDVEQSLQIRRVDFTTKNPRANAMIYDLDPTRTFQAGAATTAELTVGELLADEELSDEPYRAAVIYPLTSGSSQRGEPVVWIELLSPTNKGDTEDARVYRSKRMDVLASGLVFIEIDYLHETPPTFSTIQSYYPYTSQRKRLGAHPYRIMVLDPRPNLEGGPAQVAGFDADQAIPFVTIPLNAGENINFDFGLPYRKSYEEALYGLEFVDYTQLPLNFERYSPADQQRIANRMLTVIEAARRGDDLEVPPQPIATLLSLDEALQQINGAAI